MFRNERPGSRLVVRYNGDPQTVAPRLEREWKQITNEVPFNAKFSEDVIAELYEKEDARAQIFAAFAMLAVIDRLPRPVRPCRLHRRAADQGDRHPQGARRPQPATSSSCWCGNSPGR